MCPAAPAASASWRSSAEDTTWTGMWRVSGSCLSCRSVGSPEPTTIASGAQSRATATPESWRSDTMHLKPASRAASSRVRATCGSSSMTRQTTSPGLIASRSSRIPASAASFVRAAGAGAGRDSGSCATSRAPAPGGRSGARVLAREVERERAALADRARRLDLAAEQACDLAADRQAEARAPVAAAGRAVGLLERLEDQPQLVRVDPDAGVGDGERHRVGARQVIVGEDHVGLRRARREARRGPRR